MGAINLKHNGSGSDITLSSDGTDLLLDGTAIGGGGGGPTLFAENPSSSSSPTATGTDAVAIGDSRGIASGNYSLSLGNSLASGGSSFSVQIGNNSSTLGATNSYAIAMGNGAKASGPSAVGIGTGALAENAAAVAIRKQVSAARAYGVALGYRSKSNVDGKLVFAGGFFSAVGDAQTGVLVLRSDTTDATPEALTTSNSGGYVGNFNHTVLPDNSAFAFHGTIVARQQASGGTASAAWKVEGLIRREGSAGTTVLVNSATTVLDNTPSWGLALSANTTDGGLAITVTGAASTNIRWVATIHTSEVTYA